MSHTGLIKKAWGLEDVLVNEPEYCAKFLHIFPGKQCSLHYHSIKKETFVVMDGVVNLSRGPLYEQLVAGDSRTLPPGTHHRFSSERGATLLEVSTHHSDDDVTRLEPSGNLE